MPIEFERIYLPNSQRGPLSSEVVFLSPVCLRHFEKQSIRTQGLIGVDFNAKARLNYSFRDHVAGIKLNTSASVTSPFIEDFLLIDELLPNEGLLEDQILLIGNFARGRDLVRVVSENYPLFYLDVHQNKNVLKPLRAYDLAVTAYKGLLSTLMHVS